MKPGPLSHVLRDVITWQKKHAKALPEVVAYALRLRDEEWRRYERSLLEKMGHGQ